MKLKTRLQRGFTLIELLTVIAIVGVLIALLLPAVQSARESARQTQCRSNLRQNGSALHAFHDVHRHFPAGWDHWGAGWTTMILPQIEEQALFETLIWNGVWTAGNANTQACQTSISIYRCPSLGVPDLYSHNGIENRAVTSYGGCASTTARGDSNLKNPKQNGIFFADSRIKIKDIADGTSATFLLGERYAAPHLNVSGQAMDYWAIGSPQISQAEPEHSEFSEYVGSTAAPLNAILFPRFADAHLREVSFGSYHAGGALFCLADGSVHFIRDQIDLYVYNALGSRAGAEAARGLQ